MKAHRMIHRRRHGRGRVWLSRIVAAIVVIAAAPVGAPVGAPRAETATETATKTRAVLERAGRYLLVRKAAASADPMAVGADAFGVEKSVADKAGLGDISEPVAVHHDSIQLRDLLTHLIPDGWELRLEIPPSEAGQIIAFHAETTRRRALDDLLRKLNLRGSFYPGAGLLLVSKP